MTPTPLVEIPGGRFTVGHAHIVEAEAPNPPHEVELSPFRIGVHPVTNGEFAAFVADTGATRPITATHAVLGDLERPVVGVSFDDALAYCAWMGGTLPTEAQWELAARGADARRFPWGDEPADDERACFAQDWKRGAPSRVGDHPAGQSPFGCHDMAGSVWEWCRDVFQASAHVERTRLGADPCVGGDSRVRPLRGGCWRSIECKLQCAYRNWTHELARHVTIGFRLCMPTRSHPVAT